MRMRIPQAWRCQTAAAAAACTPQAARPSTHTTQAAATVHCWWRHSRGDRHAAACSRGRSRRLHWDRQPPADGELGQRPGRGRSSGSGTGARQVDSSSGWGRKSLAGLYCTGQQRAAAAAAAAAGGGGVGTVGVIYGGAAAGRTSLMPCSSDSSSSGSGHVAARSSAIAAAAAGAARGGRPSSAAGVEAGEYVIPSVMRVIVACPEGVQLAARLRGQQDLTPHQRCLALMRWAFGVFAQLPEKARTAIPAGPSRHNLKTWATPDVNGLMHSIFQAQTMHQQQQQQLHADWLQHQQQQQSGRESPGLQQPGSPWQMAPDVLTAAASLLAALNAVGATSAPWQQVLSGPAGFNPLLLNPGLMSLVSGLGGQQYAHGAALQQLLGCQQQQHHLQQLLQPTHP
ncbi:hypothetical protein COO60DRAFT_147232 [Scenedesmus sp. NREL 46B-D3]|nr:hypothetical protein COO60DRAFT_147232 [Scenedesmus sp. NREL 46B-D3]